MRFRAKNAGYSTGLCQVYATSYWWPCGADGRTDGHVTVTSPSKFLGLIGYQICLAIVLHWRSTRSGSSKKIYNTSVYTTWSPSDKFGEHRTAIQNKTTDAVPQHFNQKGHKLTDVELIPLEFINSKRESIENPYEEFESSRIHISIE